MSERFGKLIFALMVCATFAVFQAMGMSESFATESFPVDSNPYGISYPSWVMKWWQWIMPFPKDSSPAVDTTGANCAVNQKDENVWFLGTTFGGEIHRECNIPEGKSILIPVLIGMCDKISEPLRKSEAELRSCAWSGLENSVYKLDIDELEFHNLSQYRMETPIFNITIPRENAWGNPTAGQEVVESQAVAVGVYVLIKPLSPGFHKIHFSSSIVDNPALGTFLYAEDVEYFINVVGK